jgi:hypothetical protein
MAMTPRVSPEAQAIAAGISARFDRDREIVLALNEAQHRLLDANDQLTSGLSAEALLAIYGPAGPDLGLSGEKPPVLREEFPVEALTSVAMTIRTAFIDYQNRAEDRRQLAYDVGEQNAALTAALTADGLTAEQIAAADVHALAEGHYRSAKQEPTR